MNEQAPTFHETVAQELSEVVDQAPTGYAPFVGQGKNSIQTADIDGRRLSIETEQYDKRSEGYKTGEKTYVATAGNPIDSLNDYPEVHAGTGRPVPGAEVDLGLRNTTARMLQERSETSGGTKVSSLAEVVVPQGTYTAKESNATPYDVTGTYVERPGYGTVEINNPKARKLVASLAGKAIKATQGKIQTVKGKEEINEREWVKKTRRMARRVTGKAS